MSIAAVAAVVVSLTAAAAFAETEVTVAGHRYTIHDHPRVLFDGPAGAITTRLRDPDGIGPQVAAQANEANPACVALKARIRDCVKTQPPCVRPTLASDVLLAALDWTMDNSQTKSLAAASYWLGHIEELATHGFGFGCDIGATDCGVGQWSDWAAADLAYYALAYTLIRDQLSPEERAAFAQKMLRGVAAGYEGGCRNQLRRVSASASFAAGGTRLTGTGLDAVAAGRTLYIKGPGASTGAWAKVKEAGGSALTLAGAPQSALGGDAPSVTDGAVFELAPWDAQTCGLVWMLQNDRRNPRGRTIGFAATALSSNVTPAQTTIAVASVAELPRNTPYYVSIDGAEVVKVSSVSSTTLAVERAQLGTSAAAAVSGKPVYYTRTLPNVGTADAASSFVIQKLFGYAFIADALADESETARELLDAAVDDWLTLVLPKNKDMWTGFQQGGSSAYGSERQLTQNAAMTALLARFAGTPSLVKSEGNWLRSAVPAYLLSSLPGSEARFLPWGAPDVAVASSYYSHQWAPLLAGIYGPASEESKYWNHWQRSVTHQYRGENLASEAAARLLPYALLYFQESDPSADYKSALPPQRVFADVDGSANHALSAWISRSGWSDKNDTLVFATAFPTAWAQDHLGPGAPAAYKIYKNGWVLTENHVHDTGAGVDTNMIVFGEAANLAASRIITVTRFSSDDAAGAYSYAQISSQASYHTKANATRVLRSIAHLKKKGTQDYVVVYDSLESWAGTPKTLNLYFDKTRGEASKMSSAKLPNLMWTGPNRRLSTTVVLPRPDEAAATYTATPDAHRVAVCASRDRKTCDTANLETAFLVVHRPSASVADAMPAVSMLEGIDAGFVGVQIAGKDPKVVVFPTVGLPGTRLSFDTTYTGTAQMLVTGLEPGVYDVERNGATACDDVSASATGEAIYCELAGGKIVVAPSATAPAAALPAH